MSALSDAALVVAQAELAKGVRGGVAPYGRFRSTQIDAYMASVGLAPNLHAPGETGWPWCSAAVHWCYGTAASQLPVSPGGTIVGATTAVVPVNPYPRTAGAIHAWDNIPAAARRVFPAPGFLFFMDRGKGRGHVGFVTAVLGGGMIATLEPDTNAAGSTTGDAWGEHPGWAPADGARGTLLGYAELG